MKAKIRILLLFLFVVSNFTSYAGSGFTLKSYFKQNERVRMAIELDKPDDLKLIESKVNDLISKGSTGFPDIYATTLNKGANEWAKHPAQVLWEVYYSYVAFSIYMDVSNSLPWKISDMPDDAIKSLMGNSFFADGRFFERSTPTDPVLTCQFLVKNNMIGKNRKETVERLIDWARYNLAHFSGTFDPVNAYEHWLYNGLPVLSVLNGTTAVKQKRFNHYTAGCTGTVSFIKNVLKVVNVPVDLYRFEGTGHASAYFPSEKLYMMHGDDIYSVIDELNDREIPSGEILISAREVDSLKAAGFVGRDLTPYSTNKLITKYLMNVSIRKDSATTMRDFAGNLKGLKIQEGSAEYKIMMKKAHEKYTNELITSYLKAKEATWRDSLWYKKCYPLNSRAEIDTVLIMNSSAVATIHGNQIWVACPKSVKSIEPRFIIPPFATLSGPKGRISLQSPWKFVVTSEDKKNIREYLLFRYNGKR